MGLSLYWRYLLEFAMLFPSALFAFMPVFDRLRREPDQVLLQALILLTVLSLVGSAPCALFGLTSEIILLPCAGVLFVIYARSVRLSLGQAAFCFSNAVLISLFCTMYAHVLMAWPESANDAPVFLGTSSCVSLALTAPCCLLFWKTFTRRVPDIMDDQNLGKLWRWAFLFPLSASVTLWWIMPIESATLLVGRLRLITLVLTPIFLIMTLVLYMFTHWVARHMAEGARLEQDNQLLSMEQRRYLELKSYMDATRTQRHDFRQHLRVIQTLSAKGQLDELNAYLAQYESGVGEEHRQFCANAAVDAIAAYYDSMAAAQGARIRWTLELPAEIGLDESDLCVVIGNLTENALNALRALPPERREMTVIVKKLSGAMTGVTVENPYAGTLRFDRRGLPVAEERGHGVGLASVAAIAAKNRGRLSIDTANGVFSISALLFS